MCLKFIKGKFKRTIAFSLALLMAGISVAPSVALAETTKGIYGKEVKITHESKSRYVANATFYDYYSDSQVGSCNKAKDITDALKSAGESGEVNTFQKFNNVLLKTMQYGDATKSPAKYPLYQGYFTSSMKAEDTGNIFDKSNNAVNEASNFWLGSNGGQGKAAATQGLVDSKLKYTACGESYITTTNPDNCKSAQLPYFNKDLLTSTTFDNSELALGNVKEKVSFPFRQSVENNVTYYEFDSAKDVVRFNKEGQLEYKGTEAKEQVKDTKGNPGFFPYNTAKDSNSKSLNFGFGAKIEIPFTVTADGKINGQDIVFEFEGDDDVWVFIDDTLAMDLGGGHEKVSGKINLAQGKSEVSMVKNNSVAFASRDRALCSGITRSISSITDLKTLTGSKTQLKKNLGEEIQTKLKDTTKVHYLTVFYLERGERESNMKMKFNLPEPNNVTVVNQVAQNKVNKTFKEEAKKVAEKDEFIVGITDKNLNEYDEQVLLNKQYVSYTDEFKYNDTMQIKLNGLKDVTRKIDALYNTSYELTDAKETIAKRNGTIVYDDRAQTKDCIVLRNKNNTKTPFLMNEFKNEVATGELVIVNSVATVADKDDKFEYVVVYNNVFGGDSKAKYYEGTYTVVDEDGKKTKQTAKDGKIVLKANEKAIIEGIPAATKVAVQQQEMKELYNVETIDTTNNFESDDKKELAVGSIVKEADEATNEIIFAIEADENVIEKVNPDALDDSPDTGDTTNLVLLLLGTLSMIGIATVTAIKRKLDI